MATDYRTRTLTVDNIANQLGAGYGAECLECLEFLGDSEREKTWEELPRRLFVWFEDNDPAAIQDGDELDSPGGWPTEEQIVTAMNGLGYEA